MEFDYVQWNNIYIIYICNLIKLILVLEQKKNKKIENSEKIFSFQRFKIFLSNISFSFNFDIFSFLFEKILQIVNSVKHYYRLKEQNYTSDNILTTSTSDQGRRKREYDLMRIRANQQKRLGCLFYIF